jgi:L-asparagine transporter-like permease
MYGTAILGRQAKTMQQYHFRFVQIPRWQIVLITAVVLAFITALTVVTFGLFLLALPVLLVLGALAYLFGGARPVSPRAETDPRTIDVDYRVVDEKKIEQQRDR